MATPPRAQFVDIAGYTNPDGVFAPVTTTRVTVYLAVPYAGSQYTTLATLRSAETGSGTPGNPFDATTGEINFWAAPGSYDIKIEDLGSPAKFATKYIRWDPIPGDKGLASTMITDDAVTAPAIAASAVTSSEILDGTVGAAELASDAVTTAKILDSNVTLAKLATDSVNSSKIVDGSIAAGDLASNAVTTAKILDANVTADKISVADAAKLGLSRTGTTSRGKFASTSTVTTTSATYVSLGDVVPDVVLPSDGLIFVGYQALWAETASNNAQAAIFLDNAQLLCYDPAAGAPSPQPSDTNIYANAGVNRFVPLSSFPLGLVSFAGYGAYGGVPADCVNPATTGQAIGGGYLSNQVGGGAQQFLAGGVTTIFAAAGTYDVGVRFYSYGGGTVSVKERKLWVWTMGF